MKKNLNSLDRVIRVILALVLGGLVATNVVSGTLGIVLGVLAVVFLATSGLSFCPIYAALGWSTAKK
jgi:ABC-type Co2+ transport system permease subunit